MTPETGTKRPAIGTPCRAADSIVCGLKCPADAMMKIIENNCRPARRAYLTVSFRSASGCDGGNTDERRLHLAVAAAAESGARDSGLTHRRRGELDGDWVARPRDAHVDLQLRDREPVRPILGSDYETHGFTSSHLNRRGLERVLPRDDLHFMDGTIGSG